MEATKFSFSWTAVLPDGTATSLLACGPHPMQAETLDAVLCTAFPAGTLPPAKEGQHPGSISPFLTLDFGSCPPASVPVCRWLASDLGTLDPEPLWSEEVPVDTERGFCLAPPGDGEYVYVVSAIWEEEARCQYAFRTIPQVRSQTQACPGM